MWRSPLQIGVVSRCGIFGAAEVVNKQRLSASLVAAVRRKRKQRNLSPSCPPPFPPPRVASSAIPFRPLKEERTPALLRTASSQHRLLPSVYLYPPPHPRVAVLRSPTAAATSSRNSTFSAKRTRRSKTPSGRRFRRRARARLPINTWAPAAPAVARPQLLLLLVAHLLPLLAR